MRHGPGAAIGWLFRSRVTGRITIVQPPNVALGLFLLASAARWLFGPTGGAGTGLDVVAGAALAWWALDEVIRGVNPWRRMLGAVVLAWQIVRWGS